MIKAKIKSAIKRLEADKELLLKVRQGNTHHFKIICTQLETLNAVLYAIEGHDTLLDFIGEGA